MKYAPKIGIPILNIIKSLIIIIIISGCKNNEKTSSDGYTVISEFPNVSKLSFENDFNFSPGIATKLFLTDSTIFVRNSNGMENYFFYEYDLETKKNISQRFKGGRGFGEVFGSIASGLHGNYLWMYDITTNKLVFQDIKISYIKDPKNFAKEYNVPNFYYSIQLLDSNNFIGTGSHHSKKNIQIVDIKSGVDKEEFGVLPKAPKNTPFFSWKMANESFIFIRPSGGKAVLGHRLSDQVDFFDLKTKVNKTVKGPENFIAEFSVFRSDSTDMIQRNEHSRYGFVNGGATEKYIYLLFSGNNHQSEHQNYGKFIYVYDWEGNPIKMFTLDRYISCFTISKDEKLIYGFDPLTKFIIKAKI